MVAATAREASSSPAAVKAAAVRAASSRVVAAPLPPRPSWILMTCLPCPANLLHVVVRSYPAVAAAAAIAGSALPIAAAVENSAAFLMARLQPTLLRAMYAMS